MPNLPAHSRYFRHPGVPKMAFPLWMFRKWICLQCSEWLISIVRTRFSCLNMASGDILDVSRWPPSASHKGHRSHVFWAVSTSPIRAVEIRALISDDARQTSRSLALHCLYWELRYSARKHILISHFCTWAWIPSPWCLWWIWCLHPQCEKLDIFHVKVDTV